MKKFIICSLLIAGMAAGCQSLEHEGEPDGTAAIKEEISGQVLYPFGNPPKTEGRKLLTDYDWYFESDSLVRKQKKEEWTKFFLEASRLAAPMREKVAHFGRANSYDADSLIEELTRHFEKHAEERALYEAKQKIAMEVQRLLFPDFTNKGKLAEYATKQLSENKKKLLAFTTDLLVHSGNPNTDLIAFNLSHLENTLDDEQIQRYAELSVANAERWEKHQNKVYIHELKEKTGCDNCDSEIASLIKELATQQKRVRLEEGKKALEAMIIKYK